METGKPGLVSAPAHVGSVAAQAEKRMDVQAPLTAVYIHTVPALPAQPYPQPAGGGEPATLHLAVPPLYSKETLPFLTLHIAGGLQAQPGLSLAAAVPTARPKSAGKHVCPHCGRDCMKPSVLEKHLRCHTGERPYPCTTCGISFKTQSNLYKHKRTQAHARLSSESDQSSLGSQDSMSNSRETHSTLSLDEAGSMEKEATGSANASPGPTMKGFVTPQGSVSEQSELTPADHKTEPNKSTVVTEEEVKQRVENEKPLFIGRHLPLQRQEALLFSKQWESSVSSGKSQSHESTDSGFSESSDHPSPASVLPDHSMDSLAESTKEHGEELTSTHTEPGQGAREPKDTMREKEQEQKMLEERISKLISDNTAVVEDKRLDNVRPRKTVLSKQGSIDLPMPYTYKDSFHFDMKISKTSNVGMQRNKNLGLYSSVPTQCSSTTEHAPLTRSNSLPFSVALLQPERSGPTSAHSDYVTLVRRGSSGQINPTSLTIKPVSQQSSAHRPLVRQTAVDCNHATDGLFTNSSVEEACGGSLSCDGDISVEQSNRKSRRKHRRTESQKFAYNKWYMYGGGTFKKLYNPDKGGDNAAIKGRKCLNTELEAVPKRLSGVPKEAVTTPDSTSNITTLCHPGCPKAPLISAAEFDLRTSQLLSSSSLLKAPLRRNLSLSVLPLPSFGSLVSHKPSSTEAGRFAQGNHTNSPSQLCGAHVPSDRKKQRTDDKIFFPLKLEAGPNTASVRQQDTHRTYTNFQTNVKHPQLEPALFPSCIINHNTPPVSASTARSTSSAKTSFLPKYQLKLPNAAEADGSPQAVDKPAETTSALPSKAPEKNCTDSGSSLQMQTIIKTNAFLSTQLLSSCTAATYSLAKTPRFSEHSASGPPAVHRKFAATTITTTCLNSYQAGLCSTLIQPSKSAASSVPVQPPRPAAPVVSNFPATYAMTTASSETSADTSAAQHTPPLPPSQLPPAPHQLNPVNPARAGPASPAAPVDQVQPVAHNVFHVHTADLQICLQIISDEQLALIEPQIERHSGGGLSQIQNKAQSPISMKTSSDGRDHQQPEDQSDPNPSQSLKTVNSESIGKAEPEHSPVSASAPRTLRCSDGSTNAETLSSVADVMSTASLINVKSGMLQTTEEEQIKLDRRVSQGQPVSQTLSGLHSLSVTCPTPSTVNQDREESQETLHRAINAKGEGSANRSCRSDGGETHLALDVKLSRVSAGELSGSPGRLNPPASLCCDNPSETLSKHAGQSDDSAPLEEQTLSESQDSLNSGHFSSSNLHVERPKGSPAAPTSTQNPAAGIM